MLDSATLLGHGSPTLDNWVLSGPRAVAKGPGLRFAPPGLQQASPLPACGRCRPISCSDRSPRATAGFPSPRLRGEGGEDRKVRAG